MKKITLLLLVLIVINIFTFTALATSDITVSVNSKNIIFPDAKPFIDINNRTLIPVRFVSEALGAEVKWNAELREVDIMKSITSIKVRINDRNLVINKKIQPMDTKAIIKEDRTFVPIRYVAEALGANVEWNASTRAVIITTIKAEPINTPITTPTPVIQTPTTSQKYEPSKWVRINEGEYTELSINIDWNPIPEEFKANCYYAESAITKKYNAEIAKKVVDIARKKTDRSIQFVEKINYNGKVIEIDVWGSSIGIIFWKEGAM